MSFVPGGGQLYFEFTRVQGAAGIGVHRLSIHLRARLEPGLPSTVVLTGGATVSVEVPGKGFSVLGEAHQAEHCVFGAGMTESRLVLALDLQRHQLEAIEQWRAGRALRLWVANHSVGVIEGGGVILVSTQDSVDVNGPAWVSVLDQCEYGDAYMWTVPMPDLGTPNAEAVIVLREATRAVNEGRYDEAVAKARKVVERLWRTADGHSLLSGAARERSNDERFLAVSDALHALASGAVHADQHTRAFVWRREDALAVVGMLAILIAREDSRHR